ncbi:MAG: SprT family zinc-dependent metalloprotease [Gammaproteobacteria bacterium]
MRVFPHGTVEVVVPQRIAAAEVEAFVASNQAWIERARKEMAGLGCASDLSLPHVIRFAFRPQQHQIVYVTARGRPRVEQRPRGELRVHLRNGDSGATRTLLRRWIAAQAKTMLLPEMDRLAQRTGLHPTAVRIGRQRSRWGSCSSAGRINLNCGLLFMRPALVEYLMIHELCHLRHLNHSKRFWRLVEEHLPDYSWREAELSRSWTQVPGWLFYDA